MGLDASTLYAPDRFPQILRAQIDLMVQAMACGMTRVGVIQGSTHTSELIMSRFTGTPMYDPSFDMRSHQASHYGAAHDPAHREYVAYAQQVKWLVGQFAYLCSQLAARPEGHPVRHPPQQAAGHEKPGGRRAERRPIRLHRARAEPRAGRTRDPVLTVPRPRG